MCFLKIDTILPRQDKRIEKRFGFRLGQIEAPSVFRMFSDVADALCEVYFVPETDITDIGQFRRCYTLVGLGP